MVTTKTMPAPSKPNLSTYAGRVGARLRALRETGGIPIEKIAKACKVEVQAVYKWERGLRDIPLRAFPILKRTLKLTSMSELLPEK